MKSLLLAALLFACCLHTYGIRPNLSLPQVSTVVEDLARSPRQRIIGIEGSQAAYRQAFSGAQGMSAVLIGTQTNKTSNSVYDIVEEEALVAEYTATWLVSHVQRGIRAVSKAIRVASDTVTGLLTGSIKLFGGFFNMVASLFDSLSSRIRNRDSSSWLLRPFDKFAGNSANTFNKTGRFFHTVGKRCVSLVNYFVVNDAWLIVCAF